MDTGDIIIKKVKSQYHKGDILTRFLQVIYFNKIRKLTCGWKYHIIVIFTTFLDSDYGVYCSDVNNTC